jgi:hypothetical protein
MDKKEHSLNVLQSIISRMATNSSNCKLWCITLLTGIIVFYLGDNQNVKNGMVVLLPLIPFSLLDAYYLGLERFFIKKYNMLLEGDTEQTNIPENKWYSKFVDTFVSMFSFSIWGYYILVGIIIKIIL